MLITEGFASHANFTYALSLTLSVTYAVLASGSVACCLLAQ